MSNPKKERLQILLNKVISEAIGYDGLPEPKDSLKAKAKGRQEAKVKLVGVPVEVLLATYKKYRKEVATLPADKEERSNFLWGVLDYIQELLTKQGIKIPSDSDNLF